MARSVPGRPAKLGQSRVHPTLSETPPSSCHDAILLPGGRRATYTLTFSDRSSGGPPTRLESRGAPSRVVAPPQEA
eukprot:1348131-Rhodomonas_salina.4